MSDGQRLLLGFARREVLELPVIANSLSRICRFAGNLPEHYSVAQHSLFVADHAPPELELAALLHDAHEVILGDIPKPISLYAGSILGDIKAEIDQAIAEKYGLDPKDFHRAEIKEVDSFAAQVEYMTYKPLNTVLDDCVDYGIRVCALPVDEVRRQFEERVTEAMASRLQRAEGQT